MLSRIINSLDDVPEALRDYYQIDGEGKLSLQVSGMVPKAKLKEFRESNIELTKKYNDLKEEFENKRKEIQEVKTELENIKKEREKELLIAREMNESEYLKKVVNGFKAIAFFKPKHTEKPTIELARENPSMLVFDGVNLNVSGKFIKTAAIKSESYVYVKEMELLVEMLKKSNSGVDIFTFIQSPPYNEPLYKNEFEMDNLAVIPITSYDDWWNNKIKDKTRNLVRKAEKYNISLRVVSLNDDFIKGITEIFNESPVRQGRPYKHYGKGFDQIKKEISTYPDKSEFIGAYLENELIGFVKFVYSEGCANYMQILAKLAHREKAVTNALIAKTVELCCEKKIDYLVYRKYTYGNKGSDPLTEFKENNGFIKYDIPRYYIPITLKGRLAIKLNLHKRVTELIPKWLYTRLLKTRESYLNKKYA